MCSRDVLLTSEEPLKHILWYRVTLKQVPIHDSWNPSLLNLVLEKLGII